MTRYARKSVVSAGRALVLAGGLLSLAACAGLETDRSLAAQRAANYVVNHPDLPPATAESIRKLQARVGMTMEQVIAAWGRPAVVKSFRDGAQQQWFFGCDWPHHCSDSDEMFPMPDEIFTSQVIFENGIATDVEH